ncbi:MAG: DUF5946 family protein [Dehalococcoidia bacterium]
MTPCRGCGIEPGVEAGAREATSWASAECLTLYDRVLAYTLSLQDSFFLHQIAVDAHMASHLTEEMRPLAGAFSLLGLCLFAERGYSGKRVQLAHVQLAERRREWPRFGTPPESPAMTVLDVLASPPGESRDEAIREWGRVVWAAWRPEHERVRALIRLIDEARLPWA